MTTKGILSTNALLLLTTLLACGFSSSVLGRNIQEKEEGLIKMKLGGVRDFISPQNSGEIESLARFAVDEHNKKENTLLEFVRVLKAKEQVVAGKLYHLTLEAADASAKKIYEVKVWVKPWMNFKQLQEFKHVEGGPSFTRSDLGAKRGN